MHGLRPIRRTLRGVTIRHLPERLLQQPGELIAKAERQDHRDEEHRPHLHQRDPQVLEMIEKRLLGVLAALVLAAEVEEGAEQGHRSAKLQSSRAKVQARTAEGCSFAALRHSMAQKAAPPPPPAIR